MSNLKKLLQQYYTGDPATTSEVEAVAESQDKPGLIEEMILFPTFAYRDERLKVWRVQVRGWAFRRNPSARKVRLTANLMRRFIQIAAGGESDQLLLDRVSCLMAGPPTSSDMVKVAMAGIAEPKPFELHSKNQHKHHSQIDEVQEQEYRPSSSSSSPSSPGGMNSKKPVSLLDAPIVLSTGFDPNSPASPTNSHQHAATGSNTPVKSTHNHPHDRMVRNPFAGVEPTIIQKALQIDAFSWQNLVINEGQFQGEILLGFNELEWLVQSYRAANPANPKSTKNGGHSRRLIELRGRLLHWPDHQIIGGMAHLVEPRGVSVVSDIDDTIKASNITAEKRMLLETVFAKPFSAVPGMSKLYRQWYQMGCEFHYVSNSPWQMYPSLDDFFHRHRFPPGSAHLRSFDPSDLFSISNYTGTPQMKRLTIEQLFRLFPERKYILVGDCGEQDLETYTALARRHPGRILRIYIRDLFAPMTVTTVTTDTGMARKEHTGIVNYGLVSPDGSKQAGGDLIQLDEEKPRPPVVPPKPAHLRNGSVSSARSSTPPPKPPRRAQSNGVNSRPSQLPRNESVNNNNLTGPERLQQRVSELRENAQEWMAFYAQRFYVAPTQSFIKYSHIFMPAIEQDMRIIDYETMPHNVAAAEQREWESQQPEGLQRQRSGASESLAPPSMVNTPREPSFNAPEPPPPEAQLARNARRLLLWKRFVTATRGFPKGFCSMFVDASDINSDTELFQYLIPENTHDQI